MPTTNVLYYGRSDSLPPRIPLQAGSLSLLYEDGDLRTISWWNVEILRRVYVAVRDDEWGTVPATLSNVRIEARQDSFEIAYDASHRQGDIAAFQWQGSIVGQANGVISFTMHGEALSTFRRNRIGFCVLYPPGCAGGTAIVEHTDGSTESSFFPTTIAPQLSRNGHLCPVQPFDNLRALTHQVLPDLWARVDFEGEVFEMEDQRNWTDASFKVYGTPLSQPFPVPIEKGTRIGQAVRLTLAGETPSVALDESEHERVVISLAQGEGRPLPTLGLGVASHGHSLPDEAIDLIRALNLSHLRVDLYLANPAYKARLQQAAVEARAVGAQLEAALFLTDNARQELADLVSVLSANPPSIRQWLIFHVAERTTSETWIKLARDMLASWGADIPIGAGTNSDFVAINARRPPMAQMDFVTYSINPQVHAFDNTSLVETLAAQAETVESARRFAEGKPIVVSPVTLKPRLDPAAWKNEPEPGSESGLLQVDERQSSLFGLSWTLGSVKHLAESSVDSITYFETTGRGGVIAAEDETPTPTFWFIPGGVYPVYHLLADLGEMKSGRLVATRSSRPLQVESLMIENDAGRMLLLSNLTPHVQPVRLTDLPTTVQVRRLNETTVVEAMASPMLFRQRLPQTYSTESGSFNIELMPLEAVRIYC